MLVVRFRLRDAVQYSLCLSVVDSDYGPARVVVVIHWLVVFVISHWYAIVVVTEYVTAPFVFDSNVDPFLNRQRGFVCVHGRNECVWLVVALIGLIPVACSNRAHIKST